MALEMEFIGFVWVLYDFKGIECINICGILDLFDGKMLDYDKIY